MADSFTELLNNPYLYSSGDFQPDLGNLYAADVAFEAGSRTDGSDIRMPHVDPLTQFDASTTQSRTRAMTNADQNALWLAYQQQQRQITEMSLLLDEAFKVPLATVGGNRALGAKLVVEIHDRMLRMMGCGSVKVKYTAHPNATAYHNLPDRPEGQTTARVEKGGSEATWIPDWDAAINSLINDEFLEGVVDVVLMNAANAGNPIEHLRVPIKNAAKQYLSTLKRERRQRREGPKERKRSKDDRQHRRGNATTQMRRAQVPLRKYLGYDRTVGLAAVVRTDYVNSEWSEWGEKDPLAREALRIAQNADARALEVRPVQWHVPQLDHIYAALHGIRVAGLPAANKDPELAAILNPVDDGVDFTEEQRKMFLTIVQSSVNVRRRRANQYDRFWGRGDERMRQPKVGRLPAYQELINPSWAAASADNARIYQRAPACPSQFTILTTPMPRELMTLDDQVRYAGPGGM